MRWRDGLIFGVLLLGRRCSRRARSERLPRPRVTPALRRGLLGAVSARGDRCGRLRRREGRRVGRSRERRRPPRLDQLELPLRLVASGLAGVHAATSSWAPAPARSSSPNLRFRTSYLDFTIEPHNLPLQFLAEAGIVGLALLLLSAASLLRGSLRRRGHELALALVLPAYFLHALVDVDWDFVAVSALAFLVAGALVGGPPVRRMSLVPDARRAGPRCSCSASSSCPGSASAGRARRRWPSRRTTRSRSRSGPARSTRSSSSLCSRSDSRRTSPAGRSTRGPTTRRPCARSRRTRTRCYGAGLFELAHGCARHAYAYLEPFTELDPKARPEDGPIAYRRALRLVNSGRPTC